MMSQNQPAKRGRKPKKTHEQTYAEMLQASGQYAATQQQQVQAPNSISDRRTRAMSQYRQMQENLQSNRCAQQEHQEHHNSGVQQHNNNMYATSHLQQQNMYAMAQDPSMQNAAQQQNMYWTGTNQAKNMCGTRWQQQHMYANQVQQDQHNMFSAAAAQQNHMYSAVVTQHQDMYAAQAAAQAAAQVAAQAAAQTAAQAQANAQAAAQEQHQLSSPVAPISQYHQGYATPAHTRSPHAAHTMSPHAAHTRSPHAAHTMSPHAAHTRSPHAAHNMSPHAAHTTSPHTAHTRSPHTAYARSPHATHTMSPHAAHTMSPQAAHTEPQRMAHASNHALYPNMGMAHVPRTTASYTALEQVQGHTSGYNLRYNTRRMDSFRNAGINPAAQVIPTINSTSAAKATSSPQKKDAFSQTKMILKDDDISLLIVLRRKKMKAADIQVLIKDNEYIVLYDDPDEKSKAIQLQDDNNRQMAIIRNSDFMKSWLLYCHYTNMHTRNRMLEGNPSSISAPETNEHHEPDSNEANEQTDEHDKVSSSPDDPGTPPQVHEQTNADLAGNNRQELSEDANEQNQVPNMGMNLLQQFPFNSMLLPPSFNRHDNHNYFGIPGWF